LDFKTFVTQLFFREHGARLRLEERTRRKFSVAIDGTVTDLIAPSGTAGSAITSKSSTLAKSTFV
jgi:hypothetical protein